MPQEFVNCVDALLKQGHSKDSAYAICTAQYMKRHKGETPMQGEHRMMEHTSTLETINTMAWFYEAVKAAQELRRQQS